MNYNIKNRIEKIIGPLTSFYYNEIQKIISFEPKAAGITYDQLCELSFLLNTTKINFIPGYWEGGCPSCDEYIRTSISISGVNFKELEITL